MSEDFARIVLRGGILLFGTTPNRFLPHAGVDAAAFPGTVKDYAARERAALGSRVRGRARAKLHALLVSKLTTARAWELKETFSHFWTYKSPLWAEAFLQYWTERALRSRLEPMKKVARMLRTHEELLLNWFRAKGEVSSCAVEGLNNKTRVVTRRAYGFRTYDPWKSPSITHSDDFPNQSLPTDSADEAKFCRLCNRDLPRKKTAQSSEPVLAVEITACARAHTCLSQRLSKIGEVGQIRCI
jgi:hypothetical protein